MNISDYTSANAAPIKISSNGAIIDSVVNHEIVPYHIQINPTNRCNYRCSFCSCDKRDKKLELKWSDCKHIINKFNDLGTEAVTITGGGEPLVYPHINDLVDYCYGLGWDVGLVTNGWFLGRHEGDRRSRLATEAVRRLTWCRISISNERTPKWPQLEKIVKQCPEVDWAFSYVVTTTNDLSNLEECIKFANDHDFTHVRVVDDIVQGAELTPLIVKKLEKNGVDDSKVIYQGRKFYDKGHDRCLLSLLKPNIGPDGYIYPCCGIQYAKDPPSLDFNKDDSMGEHILSIWDEQRYYDGSVCKRCYYNEYNQYLNEMWENSKIKHKKFV